MRHIPFLLEWIALLIFISLCLSEVPKHSTHTNALSLLNNQVYHKQRGL